MSENRSPWPVLIVTVLGFFMIMLDTTIVYVSTPAGPTLGGLIVTYWDWRWIFFLNVPIGVIALLGTFLVIRTSGLVAATGSTSSASCCRAFRCWPLSSA